MKIDVSKMTGTDGASIEVELEGYLSELSGSEETHEECVFGEPVRFKGSVINNGGILKLKGQLATVYKAKCVNCLKEIDGVIDIRIDEDFVKSGAKDIENMDVFTYEGNVINPEKAFYDNIVLSIPMRHLCRDNCKGICPVCGVNLNEVQCNCSLQYADSRFDALKDFKI
jgi:uncharacterized protein